MYKQHFLFFPESNCKMNTNCNRNQFLILSDSFVCLCSVFLSFSVSVCLKMLLKGICICVFASILFCFLLCVCVYPWKYLEDGLPFPLPFSPIYYLYTLEYAEKSTKGNTKSNTKSNFISVLLPIEIYEQD